MTECWHLLLSPAGHAAQNMAVDEALLRHAAARRAPLLRIYTWRRPAASFGYFQKFPAHLAGTHELVRRPTGGGLVYHGDGVDTTYTVVAPPGHELSRLATAAVYCRLHKAVAVALQARAALHPAASASPRGQYECFQNPVAGDVVADGRKLAGAAQRRTKWGLLHQGSIATRVTTEQLADGFRGMLGVEFTPYALTAAETDLAGTLTVEKYRTETWNHRVG
jgi:lipoate-protein ligase A